MPNTSIDKLAGETALAICKPELVEMESLKTLATKALGVLQEQGVYAMIVFLLARTHTSKLTAFDNLKPKEESKCAIHCLDELNQALNKEPLKTLNVNPQAMDYVLSTIPLDIPAGASKEVRQRKEEEFKQKNLNVKQYLLKDVYLELSNRLEHLLFVKEFYEQTLIYVRHIADGLKNVGK